MKDILSGGSADRKNSYRLASVEFLSLWDKNYARSRGAIPAAQKASAFWAVFRPERWLRAVFLPLVLLGKIGYNSM